MKQKQHSTEEIIRILRPSNRDQRVDSICREYNISKATFHRWKRKYGEMDLADRLKELEKENLLDCPRKPPIETMYGPGALSLTGPTRAAR
jgi:putative transposase